MGVAKVTTCKECGAARDPKAQTARCAECNRRYLAARTQAHRAAHPGYTTAHSRLWDYYRIAQEIGAADDVEAAWIVMACEVEYRRKPRSSGWVRPFAIRELDWLKQNAKVLAKFDGAIEEVA